MRPDCDESGRRIGLDRQLTGRVEAVGLRERHPVSGAAPVAVLLDLTAELLGRDGYAFGAVAGEQRLEALHGRPDHFAEEARFLGPVLGAGPLIR